MRKITLFLFILSIIMTSCATETASNVTMELRDLGNNLLIDDVYKYSVKFPDEWEFKSNETFNEERKALNSLGIIDREIEDLDNICLLVAGSTQVTITYNKMDMNFNVAAQKAWEDALYAINLSENWDLERSEISKLEEMIINNTVTYRATWYLVGKQDYDSYHYSFYLVPLNKRIFAAFTLTTLEKNSINQFITALSSLQFRNENIQ